MARIYANRIWAGGYDYNSINVAYLRIKDDITEIMRADVEKGKYSAEEFTKITGIEY